MLEEVLKGIKYMTITTRNLQKMRMPEVETYLEKTDIPTVLVPAGTMEQHGYHLCLGTDVFIPEEVCRQVAPDLDALVAPSLNYGISDSHTGFPGVASLNEDTLIDTVADLAYSLCENGFQDVVFINGHNTNSAPLQVASNRVMRELPSNNFVYSFSYWEALAPDDLSEYLSFEQGWHANVGETAAVLAIDEDLVKLEQAEMEIPEMPMDIRNPGTLLGLIFTGPSVMYRLSDSGVWGDPTEATAEMGENYYDKISDAVTELISTFQDNRQDIYKRDRPK